MSNITEWLANLSYTAVIIFIVVLLCLRYILLRQKTPFTKSAAEITESLAIAMGLVFLIIRPFFVQAFFIPSESMVPTLEVHDHILVNKAVYLIRDPKAGEIVVFRAPPEALQRARRSNPSAQYDGEDDGVQTDYIKRVVGVPGDKIYVMPGYVTVNGEKWEHMALEKYLELPVWSSVKLKKDGIYVDGIRLSRQDIDEKFGAGSKIEVYPGYVVKNGKKLDESFTAEDPEMAYPDLTDPYLQQAIQKNKLKIVEVKGHVAVELGKDQYMMMGDNRNHSSDGRFWGPLDRNRIVGRSMFIFWPSGRIRWTQ